MDEKQILNETIKDKIDLKMKKIEVGSITGITGITEITKKTKEESNTYSTSKYQTQSYSYTNSNKSFYSKNKSEQDKPNIFESKFEYTRPIYKKKVIEPTIFMKDSQGNAITEGEAMSSRTKAVVLEEITPEQYDKRAEIFEKIRAIILPEQRSPEWFAMRNGKITASDGGAVVGKNKHEPQYNFIMKKVFGSTFETGEACYHGKKFEQVVTMMYEYKNDVYTEEFGLLAHPEHYFLGASPDGICSPFKRDKKTPTHLVGRMLEIKCPLMRKIQYSGDIKDNICPIYYWCQVQLQLECCDLDECDFVQCNIEEYKTRADWLADTSDECDFKSKKYGLERGILLEILPAKLTEDDYTDGKIKITTVYNQATFLFPPRIDMSFKELDNWVLTEIENLKPTMKLHRIVYWRLIENNCTLILRDTKWFEDNLPTLRTVWGYVEFLRLNPDVGTEWKNFIDSQNSKYNDKIIKKLIELIDNKKNPDKLLNKLEESEQLQIDENIKSKKIKKESKTEITINTENINSELKIEEKIKKVRTKAEPKTIKIKENKENKENKEDKIKQELNINTQVTETVISQIPNIKLPDDSDEEIILPNIKRPSKKK
jgi:putative phage-type endonuclease